MAPQKKEQDEPTSFNIERLRKAAETCRLEMRRLDWENEKTRFDAEDIVWDYHEQASIFSEDLREARELVIVCKQIVKDTVFASARAALNQLQAGMVPETSDMYRISQFLPDWFEPLPKLADSKYPTWERRVKSILELKPNFEDMFQLMEEFTAEDAWVRTPIAAREASMVYHTLCSEVTTMIEKIQPPYEALRRTYRKFLKICEKWPKQEQSEDFSDLYQDMVAKKNSGASLLLVMFLRTCLDNDLEPEFTLDMEKALHEADKDRETNKRLKLSLKKQFPGKLEELKQLCQRRSFHAFRIYSDGSIDSPCVKPVACHLLGTDLNKLVKDMKIAQQVKTPQVQRLIRVIMYGDRLCLFLDSTESSLQDLLDQSGGRVPMNRFVRIAIRVSLAAINLEREGFSLLRLEPRDIVFDLFGDPKIATFGILKRINKHETESPNSSPIDGECNCINWRRTESHNLHLVFMLLGKLLSGYFA